MCGIVGFYKQGDSEALHNVLDKALNCIAHRGPDFSDTIKFSNYYTAHARLKIIDLSSTANQPFFYAEKVILSYNGELYNYLALKAALIKLGYQFNTNSDTEVIAASYLAWGNSCFAKFDGMFALAIFDVFQNKIVLARDIFGKKPLYYSNDSFFCFASELEPFKFLLPKTTVSLKAINHFLSIGYVLHPNTIYEEVNMLPPSSFLEFDVNTNKTTIKKYFHYDDCFRKKLVYKNELEIIENIDFFLKEAINKRLVGDVKAGVFLSGGVDSAGVAGILKKQFNVLLPCYTIAFKNTIYNELERASSTTSFHKLEHHSIDLTSIDINDFNDYLEKTDYLTFDNSSYPIFKLSELASKNVKFVLTGDGSDEIFGGYATYKADKINQKIAFLQPFLEKIGMQSLIVKLTENINDKVGWGTKINRLFLGLNKNHRIAHYKWRQIFSSEEIISLLGKEYRDLVIETNPLKQFIAHYENVKDLDPINQHLYVDAQTWLTDNNLIKVDRNTMANGLEARCPYLDKDLITFMASVPVHLKNDKYLLKKVLENYIPKDVLEQRKVGFNSPVHLWFNTNENEFKFYTSMIFENKWKKLLKSQ